MVIEFLDKADKELFLEYLNDPSVVLMEMANLRGNDIKLEEKLPFSLFISTKSAVHSKHAIRVKVLWNPNKMTSTPDGVLELHGEYKYISDSHKYKPTAKELFRLKQYCKKYKVLFAAIWEGFLDATDFLNYQYGYISFKSLLSKIELTDDEDPEDINYYNINHCNDLEELEKLVRKDSLWNMND